MYAMMADESLPAEAVTEMIAETLTATRHTARQRTRKNP
jgi:hypothetical protein